MRLLRLEAVAYGVLRGWRMEPAPGFTVLLGRNESGKTTARDAVVTLLFGFEPQTAERHPYRPWRGGGPEDGEGEGRLVLRGEVRLDGGETLAVERVLASAPRGSVVRVEADGRTRRQRLRNEPLLAGRVSRLLYQSAFAVGAADLRMFERPAWEALEALLLGGAHDETFEPAARVAIGLEREAAQLWRPDRVGSPEAKQLQKRRSELREALREAERRAERAREALAAAEAARKAREELRARREELSAQGERLRRLEAMAASLRRLDELRARAGDPVLLEGLPADPVGELLRLEAEVEERERETASLRARREALEEEARLPDADRAALSLAGVVERARRAADALPRLREAAEELALRSRAASEAVSAKAEALLAPGAALSLAELGAALARIPEAEIEARAADWEAAAEEARAQAGRLAERRAVLAEMAGRDSRARRPWPLGVALGASLAALGGLLLALGLSTAGERALAGIAASALGAAALGAAAFLLAHEARRREPSLESRLEAELAPYAAEAERAREKAEEAARRAQAAVRDIPFAPALLEAPGQRLAQAVADLRRLTGAAREAEARHKQELAALEEALAEIRGAARALVAAGALGGRAEDADPDELARTVLARYEAARRAEEEARDARRRIEALEDELRAVRERLLAAQAARERLCERLRPFGDDARRAAHEAKERETAYQAARQLEDALFGGPGQPSLEDARREVEGAVRSGDLPWTDERRARLAAELERLAQEERAADEEYERRMSDYRDVASGPTPEELAAELASVEEAYADVCRRRDRLALLLSIVRRAEAAFREAHRPDVLRRASHHLARFTEGRYDRLDLGDPPEEEWERRAVREALTDGDRPQKAEAALFVAGPALALGGADRLWAAPPLSQGTLHQVHLALRLAVVDHLDEGEERLPVLLDDPLVHWDRGRRQAALRRLAEWSSERQVLFFTCHEHVAFEARDLGAAVVEI